MAEVHEGVPLCCAKRKMCMFWKLHWHQRPQLANVPSYDLKLCKLDPPLHESPSSELSAILFPFTLRRLEDHWPDIGGVVVTGQPGISTSLLQKASPSPWHWGAQCSEVFFLFCQNGIGLPDSNQNSMYPCQSFQRF